jgi:hypothetical protein
MALFGKEKIPEKEAAKGFVRHIAQHFQKHWSDTIKDLVTEFPNENSAFNNENTPIEFFFAVIAVQIQALPNLLNNDQAMRIREYIMEGISYPEMGDYPRTIIEEYQNAWNFALQNREDPSVAIVSVLYDKIGFTSTYKSGDTSFKSPLFLSLLSLIIASFGGPWWKLVTQKFKLVP